MTIYSGGASVQISEKEGLAYLHDLEGQGSVKDMRTLIRELQEFAKRRPLYFVIAAEGDRALPILKRLGARKYMEVWTYDS